jgi:hypothetical protein
MTDQHRATPEQWAYMHERTEAGLEMTSCILELRARVEALEAAQLEQAESGRFCTDAIVRRVEALEATQHAHVDTSRLSDAEREQMAQDFASPAAWRPLDIETTYGSEAAADAAQILRAPMVVEGTFEHGGETYRFKAKPERESAMPELRAASAEARPAGGLVERVANAIYNVPHDSAAEASAAIREVAAWLRKNDSECQMGGDADATAELLEQEADRG